MSKWLLVMALSLSGAGILGAEDPIKFFVVPLEKGGRSVASDKDLSKVQYFPMTASKEAQGILYYVEPMEKKIKSYTPKKDSMGMDYLPVYIKPDTKKILFYLEPMEKKIRSLTPKKDSMGMDYYPVYEIQVFTK